MLKTPSLKDTHKIQRLEFARRNMQTNFKFVGHLLKVLRDVVFC